VTPGGNLYNLVANTRDIVEELRTNWKTTTYEADDDYTRERDMGNALFVDDAVSIQSNVTSLDDSNWEEFHESHRAVFVNMYLKYRPHSQQIAPTWKQFADEMKKQKDWPVAIAEIDCHEYRELCRRERITAYPTLRWYEKGRAVGADYNPDRRTTVEHLKKFANDRFSGPRSEDDYRNPGDEALVDMESSVSEDQESTEDVEKFPAVFCTDLTSVKFKSWLQEHEMNFVDFYVPGCVWCQRLAPTWDKFAQEVRKLEMPIGVGKVDCMAQADLCRTEKIMAFPTLRWYHNSELIIPDYKMDRTVQAFMAYSRSMLEMDPKFKDWKPKEIEGDWDEPSWSSAVISYPDEKEEESEDFSSEENSVEADSDEKEDESQDYSSEENPVEAENTIFYSIDITERRWNKILATSPNAFIFFHSQRPQAMWERFVEQVREMNLPVAIARVDCVVEDSLCLRERVHAYPTMQWYKNGARVFSYTCDNDSSNCYDEAMRERLIAMVKEQLSSDEAQEDVFVAAE
jgi:thiol-disulfide isomerase/thioredoxin